MSVAQVSPASLLRVGPPESQPGPSPARRDLSPAGPPPPKLLDRVRQALQTLHRSRRTQKAYVGWIRRYILFHGKRHPTEMGAKEVTQFLTSHRLDAFVTS